MNLIIFLTHSPLPHFFWFFEFLSDTFSVDQLQYTKKFHSHALATAPTSASVGAKEAFNSTQFHCFVFCLQR